MQHFGYNNGEEVQDAMSVVAKWMSQCGNLKVNFHNGTDVNADIFRGVINIPKLACSGGVDEESLMLLRGRVYHEGGHILKTKIQKADWPEGALHSCFNALEDRRMEREMGLEHEGVAIVLRQNMEYYNRKIAQDVLDGKVDAPLWEALVAMGFHFDGIATRWTLSAKAQVYFDKGVSTFMKLLGCKNAAETLELAKELEKVLRVAHEDWKNQQQGGEGGESKEESKEGKQEQGKSGEKAEKAAKKESKKSEPKQGKDGEEKEEKPSKKAAKQEKEEAAEEPESAEGEADEEQEESGTGASNDFEDEGEQDEADGGAGAEEGEEGEESEEDGEGEAEGEAEEGGEGDGDAEGEAEDEAEKLAGKVSRPSLTSEYDNNYEVEATSEAEMELEAQGKEMGEYQNEDISEALSGLSYTDKHYLSRRDLDEHNVVEGSEYDKTTYKQERSKIAVAIASVVRALEQAMRARTRCHQQRFQRNGKIDMTRLVPIGKALSKDVMYTTRKGEQVHTVVEMLIDESGSMGHFRQVRQVALALAEGLSQIGIDFELTGTTTKYIGGSSGIEPLNGLDRTNPIVYKHYKLFGEQWARVCHRIVHSCADKHNVDGETVEYATRRLLARPEPRKIIISLCDGLPDAGHGNGEKMENNLVRACEKARKAGVEVYGFGINTNDPAKFYGKNNFVGLTGDIGAEFARQVASIIGNGRLVRA